MCMLNPPHLLALKWRHFDVKLTFNVCFSPPRPWLNYCKGSFLPTVWLWLSVRFSSCFHHPSSLGCERSSVTAWTLGNWANRQGQLKHAHTAHTQHTHCTHTHTRAHSVKQLVDHLSTVTPCWDELGESARQRYTNDPTYIFVCFKSCVLVCEWGNLPARTRAAKVKTTLNSFRSYGKQSVHRLCSGCTCCECVCVRVCGRRPECAQQFCVCVSGLMQLACPSRGWIRRTSLDTGHTAAPPPRGGRTNTVRFGRRSRAAKLPWDGSHTRNKHCGRVRGRSLGREGTLYFICLQVLIELLIFTPQSSSEDSLWNVFLGVWRNTQRSFLFNEPLQWHSYGIKKIKKYAFSLTHNL